MVNGVGGQVTQGQNDVFQDFSNRKNGFYIVKTPQEADSITISNENQVVDKSNNGKFDISEAGKNFVKGLLSPLTAIIKHPVATVAVVAASAAACAIVPVLGPVMAIGFGALGVFQLGKGIYDVVKNYKNGDYDKAEKCFEEVGQGTASTAMSAVGLKQSAKVAKEAKLMSELKVNTLSIEQKAKIASEVDNAGRLSALKETLSLFTSKSGLKAFGAQFKPSNVLQRGKELINSLLALRSFPKTAEGKRRSALTTEQIEAEAKAMAKDAFDEYGIPEELRPEIKITKGNINNGGGYDSTNHTITINENSYREGVFDLPNVMKHEATHAQKALIRSTLPEETRNELIQEYLLSKINNGDNNTVIYDGGILGTSTMKPPEMNTQMKTDFSNFVKNEIYGKNTNYSKEQMADMVRPFVESNSEFCSAYNSSDDAVNAMAQYARSHQIRYRSFSISDTVKIDPELLKNLPNVSAEEAKAGFMESLECFDGNAANQTFGQKLGLGGGDYNQYQFSSEEVLAQQQGNNFEISKLEAELEALRSSGNYDKSREAYLLNRINTSKATVRYKTLGKEYYKAVTELSKNPENKELAAEVKLMKNELDYLDKRIDPKMIKQAENKILVIQPYEPGASISVPANTTVTADIIADDVQNE